MGTLITCQKLINRAERSRGKWGTSVCGVARCMGINVTHNDTHTHCGATCNTTLDMRVEIKKRERDIIEWEKVKVMGMGMGMEMELEPGTVRH